MFGDTYALRQSPWQEQQLPLNDKLTRGVASTFGLQARSIHTFLLRFSNKINQNSRSVKAEKNARIVNIPRKVCKSGFTTRLSTCHS